ncbi:MAG TPA: hypothetical protein VGQ00_02850 [Candidatus Norongarragalinales archaeon]|jgi:endonuclease-3|nr:hypothetical protein [Candidatus Norongarragalinales archaeon]
MSKLVKKAERACALLAEKYGREIPEWADKPKNLISSLVQVILSQNTSDRNSLHAYKKLVAKYPTWAKVMVANTRSIEETIREGGLAKTKANRIKETLQEIKRREGKLSLDVLKKMTPAQAHEYLTSIKGTGPKTAAVVLSFSLGQPFFPVDTHIYRVARRIGFYGEKVSREKAHVVMDVLVRDEEKQNCHINMISLGREICTARNPACGDCPLLKICDYGNKRGYREWLNRKKAQ